MPEYLIAFNNEWVPDWTEEQFKERARILKPLIAEMKEAGVLIFTGGLDEEAPVFSVDVAGGTPVISDGPYAETKEHLGGFAVIEVPNVEEAQHWAGQIAMGCGWPQQLSQFSRPFQPIEDE